jgi:hypothetical protein
VFVPVWNEVACRTSVADRSDDDFSVTYSACITTERRGVALLAARWGESTVLPLVCQPAATDAD